MIIYDNEKEKMYTGELDKIMLESLTVFGYYLKFDGLVYLIDLENNSNTNLNKVINDCKRKLRNNKLIKLLT